jgi:hypothetical protein
VPPMRLPSCSRAISRRGEPPPAARVAAVAACRAGIENPSALTQSDDAGRVQKRQIIAHVVPDRGGADATERDRRSQAGVVGSWPTTLCTPRLGTI